MRAVIQRVTEARVSIQNKIHSQIGKGLLILLGIEASDTPADIIWLVQKITAMRIFGDENDKMNLSIQNVNGEFMVISQFTLHASTKKGNRPSFMHAARPEIAVPLYEAFLDTLQSHSGLAVSSGEFGAEMLVELSNSGPVTIIMDSKHRE
jgi:D-tyrosyl-tRNA(Tyr) deacylase